MHNTSLWEGGIEFKGQGKMYVAFRKGCLAEGWVRGVGSDGPARRGDVLPSQVSVRASWASVVRGTLPVPSGSGDGSAVGS